MGRVVWNKLKNIRPTGIMWVLLLCVFFLGTFGFVLFNFTTLTQSGNLGVKMVKIMYEFDDLYDLSEQYGALKAIVSDDVWEMIDLDSDSRVISFYYKFKAEKSAVQIKYADSQCVVYSIVNDYVDSSNRYIMYYEVEDGKVVSLREYELAGSCSPNNKNLW